MPGGFVVLVVGGVVVVVVAGCLSFILSWGVLFIVMHAMLQYFWLFSRGCARKSPSESQVVCILCSFARPRARAGGSLPKPTDACV
jgi:hypothetical protein